MSPIVLAVTLPTAALCGLLLVILGLRVSDLRRSGKVSLGDGGDPALLARIRAHGNFAEHAAIALVLIAAIELATGATLLLTIVAVAFVVARVAHAIGMERPAPNIFRVAGTAGSWTVIAVLSIAALNAAYG